MTPQKLMEAFINDTKKTHTYDVHPAGLICGENTIGGGAHGLVALYGDQSGETFTGERNAYQKLFEQEDALTTPMVKIEYSECKEIIAVIKDWSKNWKSLGLENARKFPVRLENIDGKLSVNPQRVVDNDEMKYFEAHTVDNDVCIYFRADLLRKTLETVKRGSSITMNVDNNCNVKRPLLRPAVFKSDNWAALIAPLRVW